MAENPKVNLALVNNLPDGDLVQGTVYMSPDVSGNFIKVAVTDSSTVTIFDGSVYTTALNDLNNRIDNIDVELLTNITYSELKALKDTSALVPGMQYRITDYECTTSAENTSVGGHAFDIIVTADSSSKLNENARAIQNEGENYFDNANLLTWELKYAIDNDSVYSWASQDGKGVVYYMKDEFDNECGYDFKNIKFAFVDSSSALIDSSTHYYYTFTDASTDGDLSMKKDSSTICEKNYIMAINDGSVFTLPHTVFIASNSVFNNIIKRASNNVFGTAYNNDMGMIEDCVFDNVFDLNTVETALNTWLKGVAEANHIKYISNSEFGNNFAFNTIRYMSNTKAGDGFMLNDVGDYFLNSSFGNNCFSNFFGPYSGTITTGNDFAENTMQNQCHHLTFGNSCKFNNMGTVGYVRMGNNCTDNFIGNGKYIYFGNSSNQGADWICGNKFEGITQYVYFYNTGSASLSNMLRKYHMYNICGTSDSWKSISETTRNNSKETFVLTRPGYTTPAANSLIYVDPAMLPERTKGGTAGQILVKVSGTDYDMGWRTVNIGSQIAYDSSNKVISLKDASGNVLGTPVDATDFIKDGMVSDVSVYDGNLVISFNTDAGKEDISIPLSHIFDSSNYYTKSESDTKYVWDSSSPWEPGRGTGSVQLKDSYADASGNYSVAEGSGTLASGVESHAEGQDTTASGLASHAEGQDTIASGYASHAEGSGTLASETGSHAEGASTTASGNYSHTEGSDTDASGNYSHAEGYQTITLGIGSHAEGGGYRRKAYAIVGDAGSTTYTKNANYTLDLKIGDIIYYSGTYAQVIAINNEESFTLDKTLDSSTDVSGIIYVIEGVTYNEYAHTEGMRTIAAGNNSHAEGLQTKALGNNSHAEGKETYANGTYSHAEGVQTKAIGMGSHAEGCINGLMSMGLTLSGPANSTVYTTNKDISDKLIQGCIIYVSINGGEDVKVIEIINPTTIRLDRVLDSKNAVNNVIAYIKGGVAYGEGSHAEGYPTIAYGRGSHAEGLLTIAKDVYSHAEGYMSIARGPESHSEGTETKTYGFGSHAEGARTTAVGTYSHAEGEGGLYKSINISGTAGSLVYVFSNFDVTQLRIGDIINYLDNYSIIKSIDASNNSLTLDKTLDASNYLTDASAFIRYGITYGSYSHSEGTNTIASGNDSHAEGYHALASGYASHAEGDTTRASGYASHAEGQYTQTTNAFEHAQGQFNVSRPRTTFSIGIGNDSNTPKNIIEVNNKSLYIENVGNFDGSTLDASTMSVAQVLNLKPLQDAYYDYIFNGGDMPVISHKVRILYIDDYPDGIDYYADEWGFSDSSSYIAACIEDPFTYGTNVCWYMNDIEIDGVTHEVYGLTTNEDDFNELIPSAYCVLKTDSSAYMIANSLETNLSNEYCPFVSVEMVNGQEYLDDSGHFTLLGIREIEIPDE